ncbi:uncharacterized protein LOC126904076 isoform X2 [Daktulosphaira vitifoliae]|uniref:uncharacterized protein LOC126904076 isoform X2 n=1 Tax=Daktulosphaira vitifoliae TaxID=58002 RepID=UPI0021A99625|nr:uncharacterized protein LOC126904076 isoform X2 [Daktulosphaira vitifoliae]
MNILQNFVTTSVVGQTLEVVNDDELLELFRTENYVLVLFSLKDCEKCKLYEETLIQIREELVDALSAWVVKVDGSNLVHIYDPTKEPALIMFRHGVPLLVPELEAMDYDLLLDILLNNRDPVVKELDDHSFEHLTQASTGATTGDWFIQFYSSDSIECQRLQARWETVGAKLKNRMNVARINRHGAGSMIARRFSVSQSPTFILIRRGALYKYTSSEYTIDSFIKFIEEDYKYTVKGEIPLPKSPLDDFVHLCFDMLRENPLIWKLGLAGLSLMLLGLAALRGGSKSKEHKLKKKSSKSSSKKSK